MHFCSLARFQPFISLLLIPLLSLIFNLSFPSCPFLSSHPDISQPKLQTPSSPFSPRHPFPPLLPRPQRCRSLCRRSVETRNQQSHNIRLTLITECLIGHDIGTIIFTVRNEQGNLIITLFIFCLFLLC